MSEPRKPVLFVNPKSGGGDAVREAVRQAAYRDAKVRTLLQTAEKVLGPSAEMHDLQLVDDGGRMHMRPAVVLVSNNPYALDPPFPHGTRQTLDSGRLGAVVLDTPWPGRLPGPRMDDDDPRADGALARPRQSTGRRAISTCRSGSRSGQGRCACRVPARP